MLGDFCSEAYAKLQKVYGEVSMNCIEVHECLRRFQEARKMPTATNILEASQPAELIKISQMCMRM